MKEIKIGGNTYTFSPLTTQDYQAVLNHYVKVAPDPVKQLVETSASLPESLRDEFIRKHLDAAFDEKKKAGTLTDKGFEAYLQTAEGAGLLAHNSLKKFHPHLSPEQALDVYGQGVAEHGEETFLGLLAGKPQTAHRRKVR